VLPLLAHIRRQVLSEAQENRTWPATWSAYKKDISGKDCCELSIASCRRHCSHTVEHETAILRWCVRYTSKVDVQSGKKLCLLLRAGPSLGKSCSKDFLVRSAQSIGKEPVTFHVHASKRDEQFDVSFGQRDSSS
jgi:hypothetical protein